MWTGQPSSSNAARILLLVLRRHFELLYKHVAHTQFLAVGTPFWRQVLPLSAGNGPDLRLDQIPGGAVVLKEAPGKGPSRRRQHKASALRKGQRPGGPKNPARVANGRHFLGVLR